MGKHSGGAREKAAACGCMHHRRNPHVGSRHSISSARLSYTVAEPAGRDLFLHMNIDVSDPKRLTHHYDLENYLTPLFSGDGSTRGVFVHVGARKCVGGGSFVV